MKKTNQLGFTLIELLVVISIIGLLSTLAVVSLNGARSKARDAKRQSDLKAIATAMELYANNDLAGAYPYTGTCGTDGVIAAATNGVTCNGATNDLKKGTTVYMKGLPKDPGSNTYLYKAASNAVYCISVQMENPTTDYYKCETGGQCGLGAAGC